MKLGIHEIIKKVREAETREEKIHILRSNDSTPLRIVLNHAYHPGVTWVLPEGDPPYKPLPQSEHINSEFMMLKEARTMYLYVNGGTEPSDHVKPARRESKFVELLEAVHPDDAKVVLEAKNRDIPGVDRMLVHEAFPGLVGDVSVVHKVVNAVANAIDPQREERLARKRERNREHMRRKREAELAAKAQAQP